MKIALVQCPGWGRDCPPYTHALLSAWLRRKGHSVSCFDLNNAFYCSGPEAYRKMWDDKDLYSFWGNPQLIADFIRTNEPMIEFEVERILGSGAKIVGFTVHFTSSLVSLEIARRIKDKDKDRLIVFGGPDCCRELRGRQYINEDSVDIVVVGEGELTLLELAEIIENSNSGKIDFCAGTLLKNDGRIIDCGDRQVVRDLDFSPIPDYSDYREEILSGHYRQPERLEILDSRGCIICCHFCSEWQFWKNFRSLSGERMFEEVSHQVKNYPGVNYFYFIGSLLNGDIKALSKFCDLLIDSGIKIRWAGQAVVRPEMTEELLGKMRRAGCEWLGIGIESGSEKVLAGMNKRFTMSNAEDTLRYAHQAGINVQANFMFGIPGETEADFRQTLDFLKRNRENMDSVLASQSFCVIDKGTYLHANADKLGIKNADHHLYWETEDNDYAQRFRRYEEFCRLALSLGLPETSGVLSVKPDKWLLLGDYYLFKEQYPRAEECFRQSLALESWKELASKKIELCREKMAEGIDEAPPLPGKQEGAVANVGRTSKASDAVVDIPMGLDETQEKIKEALSRPGLETKLNNYLLIEKEKGQRQEYVTGFPYWLTIDPANYCNLQCPFCPTGQGRGSRTKGMLSVVNFKEIIDELGPYLIHIDFCNWGEPLLNRGIFEMVKQAKAYHIDTKIDTNFNSFSEKSAEEMILSGLDKLIVSMDGITPETYAKYRVGGDFNKVMDNLKMLLRKRGELRKPNPYISWQFLVFRHNEHEIEEARKIAKDLGVDNLGVTKAFIGNKDWMPLNEEYSHYKNSEVKDGHTSDHFKSARREPCNWPWEAITINPNGSVSPCCSVEDEKYDFGNIFKSSFSDIWNNDKYRQARRFIKDRMDPPSGNMNICIGCKHMGLTNLNILSCHSLF